jgi:carbon monoxide dehydrogenase subunit G
LIEISGSYTLEAGREAVWPQIVNLASLQDLIPGCQSLVEVSPGQYKGHIVLSLPAVSGEFVTLVTIEEQMPPSECRFSGEVSGPTGRIVGRAAFSLADAEESTLLRYEAQGMITGALAKLPSRVIRSVAGALLRQGLARLNRELAESVIS